MRILIFGKGGISGGIAKYLKQHEVIEVDQEHCDVRDREHVGDYLWVYRPDWVINCAGVSNEESVRQTIDTNLIGAFNVAYESVAAGLPHIQIASVAGLYGKPDHAAYCASKAGVISLVQSLGFKHQAWAISPGRVDTPLRERDYPNDTPGSRLCPIVIGMVVEDIIDGLYESGANLMIRKIGLDRIELEEVQNPWRETLRVGLPVTI